MKHIRSPNRPHSRRNLRTWYINGNYRYLGTFCNMHPYSFRTYIISILLIMTKRISYLPCCACLVKSFTKTNHRRISQEVRLFSSRGWFVCFSSWKTYLSGTRLQDPHPCSWPLHGGFFFFCTAILVILLRLFTFIHHWHHIRARRIWLAYKVGPCAVFADMRSFFLLVIRL